MQITIFLAIYNGSQFLNDQLQSFIEQSHNIKLIASLDSEDLEAKKILAKYFYHKNLEIIVKQGPTKGFVTNFLSMVCNNNYTSKYYAYSDQDDVWYSNKLNRAIAWLDKQPSNTALLWCSTTTLINENGKIISNAEIFYKQPSFKNAIVQSIAAGCTMVFNHKTRELLQLAGMVNVISHDWWTYIIVTGCGGKCYYDAMPSVFYRQHQANIVGSNIGIINKIRRINRLFQGQFYKWNNMNISALQNIKYMLTSEAQYIIQHFVNLRHPNIFKRLKTLVKLKLYRQTFLGQLGLWVACVFKKI